MLPQRVKGATSMNWDMVAASANVMIATTAVVAAWYALRQYRYALRVQEMSQILAMHQAVTDLTRRHTGEGKSALNREGIVEALNLMEVHERLISEGLLSQRAIRFYRDAIAISDDFGSIEDETSAIVRDVLRSELKSYKHLVAALRKRDETRYLVDG
jgi:hypothetical protein